MIIRAAKTTHTIDFKEDLPVSQGQEPAETVAITVIPPSRPHPSRASVSRAPWLRRAWAAVRRNVPTSHLLTIAILALLWSGVLLWRFG